MLARRVSPPSFYGVHLLVAGDHLPAWRHAPSTSGSCQLQMGVTELIKQLIQFAATVISCFMFQSVAICPVQRTISNADAVQIRRLC